MIYCVDGRFGSRKGVDIGAITLPPSGLPHGPQPGLVEKAIGVTHTEEPAVMFDPVRPLKITTLSRDRYGPSYAYSWFEAEGEEYATTITCPPSRGTTVNGSSTSAAGSRPKPSSTSAGRAMRC